MTRDDRRKTLGVVGILAALVPAVALSHGNIAPQPVDTTGLAPLGEAWLETNPYRGQKLAVEIGHHAYNMQCARCHGLEAISGGLAPDLRSLDKGDDGDKEFLPPVRHGVYRDGRALMPKYEGIVSQEAMWAIRSWLETVHED